MQKNKQIHIAYIGRLEKEKGIEMVIDSIKRSILEERNIFWHICGDGSYLEIFQGIQHPNMKVYGYLDRGYLVAVLEQVDLVLMPSLFLETFGLVALETLTRGVGVCGFSQGGLSDFIHPSLSLDRADPVSSFFEIVDRGTFPILDISNFSYERWVATLKKLTE